MLLEINRYDKMKSKYICDRCKTLVTNEDRIIIAVGLPNKNIKRKWDLCIKCYNALYRGINKGTNNNKSIEKSKEK